MSKPPISVKYHKGNAATAIFNQIYADNECAKCNYVQRKHSIRNIEHWPQSNSAVPFMISGMNAK
jgi:hypothetical protein